MALSVGATTLILKMSKKLSYEEFVPVLQRLSKMAVPEIAHHFDFVHLPWKKLAVVNFTSSQTCAKCFHIFSMMAGKEWVITDLKEAHYQGLAPNLALFCFRSMDVVQQHKPQVFLNGLEVPLPLACKQLVTPELMRLVAAQTSAEQRSFESGDDFILPPPGLEKRISAPVHSTNGPSYLPPWSCTGYGGTLVFEL